MRIVSGKLKGRQFTAPKNLPVRPTTNFAKEGLFNILQNKVEMEEVTVLDLFSGIGSIAFEFASRGAKEVVAVDKNHSCINFIKGITEENDLDIKAFTIEALKFLERNQNQFDIIFADPPYEIGETILSKVHQKIFEQKTLRPQGMLILEHNKRVDLTELTNFVDTRKYGKVNFSFFYER